MIATIDEMKEVTKEMFSPEVGASEAYYDDFNKWFKIVADRDIPCGLESDPVRGFDIVSIVEMFDDDLKEYAKICEREFDEQKCT